MKDQHIPNIFQHCPGKWGEGEVTRNVAKKIPKKYNLCISEPNVLNLNLVFIYLFFSVIFMDLSMPVQGCGQTQNITTEASHILLCSAFVHFLVLHECSLCGIFLWTLIASKPFLCIWCLFGAKFILFAQASGNMFLLLCLLQNVPSHLGHPKGEHRPWSSCIWFIIRILF